MPSELLSAEEGLPPMDMDADASGIHDIIQEHASVLCTAAEEHLLQVKQKLQSQHGTAVAATQASCRAQLDAMQAQLDASNQQVTMLSGDLERTKGLLDSVVAGYSAEGRRVKDLLLVWQAWRAWVQYSNGRKLHAFNKQRADDWYSQYYLYRRVFWGWQQAAKARYRLLMASRHTVLLQQHEDQLRQEHGKEVEQLRQQIEDLKGQLQQQLLVQERAEEDMKRAFMRGVTALNLEALQVMKRGTPHLLLSSLPQQQASSSVGSGAGSLRGSPSPAPAAPSPAASPTSAAQQSLLPSSDTQRPMAEKEEHTTRLQGAFSINQGAGQQVGHPQQALPGLLPKASPAAAAAASTVTATSITAGRHQVKVVREHPARQR